MISPRAIEAYLARPADDHNWVKSLTADQVDGALHRLQPRPRLRSPLRLHQRASFLLGVAYPEFFFFLDMGTGKTILTLELLLYWIETGHIKKALIQTPSNVVVDVWEEQINKWMPGQINYTCLRGTSAEKWDLVKSLKEGLIIGTYPGIYTMVCSKQHSQSKGRNVLVPDEAKIRDLARDVGAGVLDESTKVGNHDSLPYRVTNKLLQGAVVRYALSGRAFGRSPMPLWAQYNLIDKGKTLGVSLGIFREAYFTKSRAWGARSPYAFDYTFNKRLEPELTRAVGNRAIRYSAEECIDLPDFVPIVRKIPLETDAETYYRKMIQQIRTAHGNFQEIKAVFIRMRQICSGYLGVVDDDTEERAEIEFGQNPKLDELMGLIGEMPYDRKGVIFHEFTWSGRRIMEEFKKAGIKAGWLWSGTKNWPQMKERFLTDPETRFLIVNHRKGAYGVDRLQEVANYTFFYESPVSFIDREQAERRIRRDGQKRKVFQYDLVIKGSVEERILHFHKEGADLFRALVEDPARVVVAD